MPNNKDYTTCICYFVLNLPEHPDNGADIARILGIADVFQPQQVVSALVAVLYLRIIGRDALRPMGELVIFSSPGIDGKVGAD